MRKYVGLAMVALLAAGVGTANAVVINEVLGSTTSTDTEFIELYNPGPGSADVSGWQIELWDSDAGNLGGSDAGSPYVIPAATVIPAGGYYLMANPEFGSFYTATPDFALPANAIENSSYTIILKDAGLSSVDSIFVNDGDAGDTANDAGTAITPGGSIGPDGSFLPAGFYRVGDGNPTLALLEFGTRPAPSATPGAANLPEPASLALVVIGGLLLRRRR